MRWKESKSQDTEDGYILLYYGLKSNRNGVGVAVSKILRNKIDGVDCIRDWLRAQK